MGAKVAALLGDDDNGHALAAAFAARCTADEWSAAARRCVVATSSITDPKRCRNELTFDQIRRLDQALALADRELAKATIPEACLAYERLVAVVEHCKELAPDLRDTVTNAFIAARRGWDALSDKRGVADSCRAASTAVRQLVPVRCVR